MATVKVDVVTMTWLRADVAMRQEDARIARKHMEEAAARPWTPENVAAYEGACAWLDTCRERLRVARVALIGAAS